MFSAWLPPGRELRNHFMVQCIPAQTGRKCPEKGVNHVTGGVEERCGVCLD